MASSQTMTLDARLRTIAAQITDDDVEAARVATAAMDRFASEADLLQFNMFAEERQA